MAAHSEPEFAAALCEIIAPRVALARALAEIAATCARDVGQPIKLKSCGVRAAAHEPMLTLHLSAEVAASQHRVWCLACRLACFCPEARISVLVHGEGAFAAKTLTPAREKRRTA